MKYNNILDQIGNTPIVKIKSSNNNVNIYAKLEGQNPGGSVKDRIALSMIIAGEKSGELTKDKIILEPTSGNTGIGLALVGAVKGYRVTLTMSAGMSNERKKMLTALGAKLILTPAEERTDGAIKKAHEMIKNNPDKYWMPYQFDNPNNPLTHYNGTGVKIIKQVPDITHFVAGIGTGGTLMGIAKRLKEYNKNIKIIGIEPQLNHKIAGLKNMQESIIPKIYDEKKLDKKIVVNNEQAYETARQLAKQGIFVGMSSGAAMYGALQVAHKIKTGNIVVIFPDRGEKYLSTKLFL